MHYKLYTPENFVVNEWPGGTTIQLVIIGAYVSMRTIMVYNITKKTKSGEKPADEQKQERSRVIQEGYAHTMDVMLFMAECS